MKKYSGVSLIEILVTIGILISVSSLVYGVAVSQLSRSTLRDFADRLYTTLNLAQNNTFSSREATEYGVSVNSSGFSYYIGPDLSHSTYSTTIPKIPTATISVTGENDIHFSNQKFKPSSSSKIHLTDGTKTYTVEINSEGSIDIY